MMPMSCSLNSFDSICCWVMLVVTCNDKIHFCLTDWLYRNAQKIWITFPIVVYRLPVGINYVGWSWLLKYVYIILYIYTVHITSNQLVTFLYCLPMGGYVRFAVKISFENYRSIHPSLVDDDDSESDDDDWCESTTPPGIVTRSPR